MVHQDDLTSPGIYADIILSENIFLPSHVQKGQIVSRGRVFMLRCASPGNDCCRKNTSLLRAGSNFKPWGYSAEVQAA